MRVGKRANAHFFFRYYPPLSRQSEIKTAGCADMRFFAQETFEYDQYIFSLLNNNIESFICNICKLL